MQQDGLPLRYTGHTWVMKALPVASPIALGIYQTIVDAPHTVRASRSSVR